MALLPVCWPVFRTASTHPPRRCRWKSCPPRNGSTRPPLQGRCSAAVLVGEIPDAAADGQRHENVSGRFLEHLDHGHVFQGEIPEPGDVQKSDLVGPLLEVASGQFHRFAQVAHVSVFTHIVLVAFGHHQIAPVVGTHIQAGNDALGQAGLRRAFTRDRQPRSLRMKFSRQSNRQPRFFPDGTGWPGCCPFGWH